LANNAQWNTVWESRRWQTTFGRASDGKQRSSGTPPVALSGKTWGDDARGVLLIDGRSSTTVKLLWLTDFGSNCLHCGSDSCGYGNVLSEISDSLSFSSF